MGCKLGHFDVLPDHARAVLSRDLKRDCDWASFLVTVYDSGTVFSPQVLDITDDDIRAKFMQVSGHVLPLISFNGDVSRDEGLYRPRLTL